MIKAIQFQLGLSTVPGDENSRTSQDRLGPGDMMPGMTNADAGRHC